MIEEPYRWLEAIGNRREYVSEQIKGGSPVFAVSMAEGILVLGVGSGQSKVFELFDRHALAGLGHPADIEKIRQAAIDAAHVEAFQRAPEDVSLKRLVAFGLSGQLKTQFEQVFSAPILVELILTEVSREAKGDVLVRLHFDGSFEYQTHGLAVAAGQPHAEAGARDWLLKQPEFRRDRAKTADLLLQAWWCLTHEKSFQEELPTEQERSDGWRKSAEERVIEIGWLARKSARAARYEALALSELGL